jgi:DNA-nicking Smr family endonuclease
MLEQAPKALPRDARANDRPPKSPPPVRRKRRPRSASGGPAGRSQVNRHGLPVLTAGDDWQQRWQASEAGDRPAREPATVQANRTDDCQRTDKHGIPVLDDCHDLGRLLTASEEKSPADNDLVEAFQQSIDHDARTLIKKKTDGHFPVRQLTLKERLQRYPQPQRQLDLHGLKALQAQQRADHFIRAAHADGLFTLRIIVGKGLHSESGAVLPDVVEDRLIRLKRDGLVLAYRWEKGVKRKSGAVLVFIDPPF